MEASYHVEGRYSQVSHEPIKDLPYFYSETSSRFSDNDRQRD